MARLSFRCPKPKRGAVALELAIVLPIFLLTIIGILEFGRVVMAQQIITNASREGARKAILPGATDASVLDHVNDYLDNATIGSPNRTVEIRDSAGDSVSLAAVNSHDSVSVFVSVPYSDVGVGIGNFFVGDNLTANTTMRKE